jgi:hypothetical protein
MQRLRLLYSATLIFRAHSVMAFDGARSKVQIIGLQPDLEARAHQVANGCARGAKSRCYAENGSLRTERRVTELKVSQARRQELIDA